MILAPDALGVSYGARTGTLVGLGHGGRAAYVHRFGNWALGAGIEAGTGAETTGANDVRFSWVGGEVRFERRLPARGDRRALRRPSPPSTAGRRSHMKTRSALKPRVMSPSRTSAALPPAVAP